MSMRFYTALFALAAAFELRADTVVTPELVEHAYCSNPREPCRLNEVLVVEVQNLDTWATANKVDRSKLTLVLDGRVIKGTAPFSPGSNSNQIAFDLKPLTGTSPDAIDNRAAWGALLSGSKGAREMKLAVSQRPRLSSGDPQVRYISKLQMADRPVSPLPGRSTTIRSRKAR